MGRHATLLSWNQETSSRVNTLNVPDSALIMKIRMKTGAVVHEHECHSYRHVSPHMGTGPVMCSKSQGRSLDAGCSLKTVMLMGRRRVQEGILLWWLCHMLCLPQEAETKRCQTLLLF